jgi:hypothetical protein
MGNTFKILDFVTNPTTGNVHIVTGLPSNEKEQSVFNLSEFVEIDGLKGSHPHYKNFRHSTKEEVINFVESKFNEREDES